MVAQSMGCGTSTSRTGTPDYQKAVNVEILEMRAMPTNAVDIDKRVRNWSPILKRINYSQRCLTN
jgi:hypothetical protein